MKCGHCKRDHPTSQIVRICSELHGGRTAPNAYGQAKAATHVDFFPPAPTERPVPTGRGVHVDSQPKATQTRQTNVRCSCDNGVVLLGKGAFENGRWTGSRGQCYRCRGKGWQTPADQKRNLYYDNHVRRV